jgi:hypothetical protein
MQAIEVCRNRAYATIRAIRKQGTDRANIYSKVKYSRQGEESKSSVGGRYEAEEDQSHDNSSFH